MKKITFIIFIGLLGLSLTNCKKEVDDRDAFIGTYTETTNGALTMTINGTASTVPINDVSSFTIEKSTTDGKVRQVYSNESHEATVSGNSIVFDAQYVNMTENGVSMQLTLNSSGTLSGLVLNYSVNVTGTGYYNGYSFPINGLITSVATKQ